jgi:hypothetical protein
MFRSDLSENWASDKDLWKESFTSSTSPFSSSLVMKYSPVDSSKKGLEEMPVDTCAEKLTKKLDSTYVNGYTKAFFHNNLDTTGN